MQWEYKITRRIDEEAMNKLGAEGWELVTIFYVEDNPTEYFFKRPY